MNVEVKVPSVGESVVEAAIGSILKPSGSYVKAEEEILELETDKVNQAVYAPASGLLTLTVNAGDTVKIGQTIGTIDSAAQAPDVAAVAIQPKSQESVQKSKPQSSSVPPAALPPVRVSVDESLAQKAPERESSPPSVKPTPKSKGKETRQKMTKLRRVIADRLVQVKNQTAMLTTFNEVDLSQVISVREQEQESFQKKHGVKLGFMSFFVKACVAALKDYPAVNARIESDEMVFCNYYDIGIAVGTEKGLMVPVIRNADQLTSAEIERQLKTYAEKARSGTIALDDLQGGTFTITNGGTYGSMLSTPILNPPQSGILGMHNIIKRPVALNDQVVIRPMMYLALSYDHRIIDGKDSIGFLVHIKKNLEEPARLLLDL